MEAMLSVQGLQKNYEGFTLGELSFSLDPGYILGLVGITGAGKTTLIQSLCHLLLVNAGEVRIDGISFSENPVAYREAIGYVADTPYFSPLFTLRHIEGILRDFYPTFDEKRFRDFTKKWKLPEDKTVGSFSRGMQVKLMFASVLSRETKILLLDEATNGLDAVNRADILELLQSYVEDGKHSILFSTHLLNELENLTDYLLFLENGKMRFFEDIETLRDRYSLVKGSISDLTPSLEKVLYGLRRKDIGFTGLAETKDTSAFPSGIERQTPTIDDIVRFLSSESEV